MTQQPAYLKSEGDKKKSVLKIFKEMERKNVSPCLEPSRAFNRATENYSQGNYIVRFFGLLIQCPKLVFMFIG